MTRATRLALGVLGALALSGWAGAIVAFRQAVESTRRAAEIRLDPTGQRAELEPVSAKAAGQRRVILLGDSRAAQWPAPSAAGFEMVNRGLVDQSTEQILARFDLQVAPLAPDVVVLQAGINDLKAIPLLPDQREAIVARCTANLQAMVVRSRALGARVIISTIFPTGHVPLVRRPIWSAAIGDAVRAVNAVIRGWEAPGVHVLDAYALLEDGQGALRAELGVDTLHLSAEGYRVLDAALSPMLVRSANGE